MLKPVVRTLVALLLLGAVNAGLPPSAHAETLRIGGTGAGVGTMRLLAEAFARKHQEYQVATIEVLPSLGSGGGIKALAAGSIDLAVSSRGLKDAERARGLHTRAYGRTALVFATPADNSVNSVTSAELAAIFGGTQNAWSNGTLVRPILRPKAETDTKLAEEHIPGLREALEKARSRPAVPLYFTDQETADALERIPGSVGTMSLSVIQSEKRRLKALTLDGHTATPQSIADGSYPIIKTLYFVIPAKPSQFCKVFLDFAYSAEGRAILEKAGQQALPAVSG